MIVLDSTRAVVEQAEHVRIDDAAISRWAATVSSDELQPTSSELPSCLPGDREALANLVLLMDALNFCFWSSDPITAHWRGRTYGRYEAMFVSLMTAARHEPRWCEAEYWLTVPKETIRRALFEKGELLLLDERERIIRETGRTLIDRFGGSFFEAVDSVNDDAWALSVLLMTHFDSYRDVSTYRQQPVFFLKRAQICALDLSVAWETHGYPPLGGLEKLTAFADYRIPQALRHLGIMVLKPELAERIDNEHEIDKDSRPEVELRAASIQSIERMREALAQAGCPSPAWQIDWYLWGMSHRADIAANHHRTRTVNY